MTSKIDTLISEFAVNLRAAIAEEAAAAFATVAGPGAFARPSAPRGRPAAAKPAAKASSGKRVRRSAEDVQAQLDQIVGFLKKSKEPAGAEAIGAALGMSTIELASPVKLGLSSKALKKTGKLRGTKYSVK